MRVIAGTARRLPLKTVEGLETRPTTDRIKETLFNMIHNNLYDAVFLDLFSGSGAIGIEALSRGAKKVVFVENSKAALDIIKYNLKTTKLSEQAEILGNDVLQALELLDRKKEKFDFIFMDPPYNKELERRVLTYLEESEIVHDDTIVIIEAILDTDFSYLEHGKFELYKKKEYKTNMHAFIRCVSGRDAV